MYRGVRSGFGVLRLPELVLLFLCLVFGEAFCGVEALAAPDGKRGRAVPDTVVALSLVEDDDDKGDAIFELVLLKDKPQGGDPEAQFELGRRYLQGVGLERNDVMALHWIRAAAEQGFAQGRGGAAPGCMRWGAGWRVMMRRRLRGTGVRRRTGLWWRSGCWGSVMSAGRGRRWMWSVPVSGMKRRRIRGMSMLPGV